MKLKSTDLTKITREKSHQVVGKGKIPLEMMIDGKKFRGQVSEASASRLTTPINHEKMSPELISIIHDLNNQVSAIIGNTELGILNSKPDQAVFENLSYIKTACSKVSKLLQKLNPQVQSSKLSKIKIYDPELQFHRGRGRILVMDDKLEVRNVVGQILTKLGYEVDTAEDGMVVLEKYEKTMDAGRKYDVVILDVNIPGGFGAEMTIQELFKIDSEVNAIVFSGCHNVGIMNNYDKFGFRGYVTKPFTVEELRRIIKKSLSYPKCRARNYPGTSLV